MPQLRDDDGAVLGRVEAGARKPPHRAEPDAGRASRRVAVLETTLDVHAGAAIDRGDEHDARVAFRPARHGDGALARVLDDVGCQLGRDDLAIAAVALAPLEPFRVRPSRPPHLRNVRPVADADRRGAHLHRVTLTRVPVPTLDSISNSLISRREPDSPNPRPVPVESPSRGASSASGIPGPESTKSSRSPLRWPSTTCRNRAVPPPPCSTVLRASSLAAVTILVWST